jgi:hypothetical protein
MPPIYILAEDGLFYQTPIIQPQLADRQDWFIEFTDDGKMNLIADATLDPSPAGIASLMKGVQLQAVPIGPHKSAGFVFFRGRVKSAWMVPVQISAPIPVALVGRQASSTSGRFDKSTVFGFGRGYSYLPT